VANGAYRTLTQRTRPRQAAEHPAALLPAGPGPPPLLPWRPWP